MVRIVVSALLCFTFVSPAFASSAEQIYEKGKRRYFTRTWEKPKVYCVCLEEGENHGRIGVLREWMPDRATCYFLGFDEEGNALSESPCFGSFTVVGK